MAEEKPAKPKRRIIKKAETVREKVEKNAAAKPKKRGVMRLTLHYISWPFRMVGRGLKKIGRYVIPGYFKKSWQELRQVTWPTGRDAWKLTLAVIIFAIVFGALVTAVDFVLGKVFKEILIN